MIEALSLAGPLSLGIMVALLRVWVNFSSWVSGCWNEQALAETTLQLLRKQLPQPLPNTFVLERMQRQTLNVYAQLLDAD